MCSLGGSQKTKSGSSYTPTPQAAGLYTNVINQATTAAGTPYNPATEKNVAGFTPDQLAAFGNISANAGNYLPYLNQAGAAANEAAGPISAESISAYMDPYRQQVIDATTAEMQRQGQIQQSQLAGNAAAMGALGGNRVGVAQGELARGTNANIAQTVAGLLSGGYGQALSAAQQDAARKLQASSQFGNLAQMTQGLSMNDVMAQLMSGGQQQQQEQNVLDASTANAQQQTMWPYQNAQWLAGIASGIGPLTGGKTTGTQTTSQNKGAAGILGAGLSLASMFSDRRMKEDVTRIGSTDDGQPIYKFRYKGSPKFQIGLMSDDVKQSHPEAVSNGPYGLEMVDYDKATEDAEGFASGGGVGFTPNWGPWAELRPAALSMPSLPSAPAMTAESFDPEKSIKLGKSARSGIDSIIRGLDPAGGWGASVEPAAASGGGKGLGGLTSLLSGFAHGGRAYAPGGGVFDDLFGLIGPKKSHLPEPPLKDDFIGEVGESGIPGGLGEFNTLPPAAGDMPYAPVPKENEFGGTPAPRRAPGLSELGGFNPIRRGAPAAISTAPAPVGEASPMSSFWPNLFGSKDESARLDFDPSAFGLYGREPARFAPTDSEATSGLFTGEGGPSGFAPMTENHSAGAGLSTRDFIKQEEGWHAKPKWDGKQWTNGWGTRASGPNDMIDKAEADRRLDQEIGDINSWIDKNVKVPMTPGQRAGLTSFAFNGGTGWLQDLLPDINAGRWDRVAKRMPSFAGVRDETGKLQPGVLTERRLREVALLNDESPVSPGGEAPPVAGNRGTVGGGALAARGSDPDAPVVSQYRDKTDKAAGGLLKRWFGVDFNPLKLSENERMAMLAAGLGMMSTGNIGSGGLMGMQYLRDTEAAEREADFNARKLALELYKADASIMGKDLAADKLTNDQKEYQQAKEEGFGGSLLEWLQAKGEAAKSGTSGKIPAELAARIGLADTFLKDFNSITSDVGKFTLFDNADLLINRGKAGDVWRRIETGLEAMRRMQTGAGMPQSEADQYVQRYQITPRDSKETKLSKLSLLKRDLEGAKEGALSGATGEMGRQYRHPTPEVAPMSNVPQRPADLTDEEIIADAAKQLRSGATPAQRTAILDRLRQWGIAANGLGQ